MKEKIQESIDKSLFYGLVFVSFFLPIYNSLASLGIGLCIFSLLFSLFFRKPALFSSGGAHILFLCLFLIFCVSSLLNSQDLPRSLIGLRKLFMLFFLYLAVMHSIKDAERSRFIIFVFLLSGFIVSLDGIYQFFHGTDWFSARPLMVYPHLGIKRITASFHQAGSLGIYLDVVLPICLSLTLFYFSGFKKALMTGASLVMLLAMTLTFAPGSAFGVYAVVLFFVCVKKNWRLLWLLLLGLVIGSIFLPESLISWPNGSLFGVIRGRMEMWEIALKMIKMHPFLGMGLHTFPLNYEKYCLPGYPHCGAGAPYAHNMYIHMAAEIGLFGLSSFLSVIFLVFKKAFNAYKNATDDYLKTLMLGSMGGMVAYLVHGMLESSLYTSQGAVLFWLLFGLMGVKYNH